MAVSQVIIPAQIRAGRALLDWSQEQLASKAEVGISSIRDVERQKRPAETGVVNRLRQALENGGVAFSAGTPEAGPGVHLVANRPNVIRMPTAVMKFAGVPFEVELNGKRLSVVVSREVLEDLDQLGAATDEMLFKAFEKHVGTILDAVLVAAKDQSNFEGPNDLVIRPKDVACLMA